MATKASKSTVVNDAFLACSAYHCDCGQNPSKKGWWTIISETIDHSGKFDDVCEVQYCDEYKVQRLKPHIPRLEQLAETFRVLGDETRCRLVYCLSQEELCVCDLAAILDLSSSLVSHHLRILRHLRLVKYRKEGKRVFYSLDDAHILNLINEAIKHVSERASSL